MLKNVFKTLALTLSFLLGQHAYALELSCPEEIDQEGIVKLLLAVEFAGARVDGMEDHECLDQAHFPYMAAVWDASQEESHDADVLLTQEQAQEVRVIDITAINEELGLYRARFEVSGRANEEDSLVENFEDELTYMRNFSVEAYRHSGCAHLTEAPKRIYARKECRP